MKKVFIDTNILKYAADHLERWFPIKQTIVWGANTLTLDVYRPATVLPNEKLADTSKTETKLLPQIAEMANRKQIEILLSHEVMFEFWHLPNTDGQGGRFYGAPITWVNAPIQYSRLLGKKEYTISFLKNINHNRFKQLQVACGAYQGENINENQLIDAFHIWCAEAANTDYFLTCEKKLINQILHHKKYPPKVKVILPSTLIKEIGKEKA